MLKAQYDQNDLTISLYLVEYPPGELFDSLEEGIRSQIQFELRVYQRREGLLSILGDKLIHEHQISHEAKWDVFNRQFILIRPDGSNITFYSKDSFISAYFAQTDIPMDAKIQQNREYYVQGRIILETVKFLPPLNILSDIIPGNVLTTDWERYLLPIAEDTS